MRPYLGAVPEGCDGSHCLFTSLLIFQLSQEFAGLVRYEKETFEFVLLSSHDFLPRSQATCYSIQREFTGEVHTCHPLV